LLGRLRRYICRERDADKCVLVTLTTNFTAQTGDHLCAIYGTVSGGPTSANLLATDREGWREEWATSSTNPANVSPFGAMPWDASIWVAGSSNTSVQSNPTDPNYFRYITVQGGGGVGNGARVITRLQQPLTTGAQWQARIIFRLSAATNIRALAGFGQDTTSQPLAWILGVAFDDVLGDTDFMFIAGTSNVAAGAHRVSSGVPVDTLWHDALITWISNTQFSIALDAGAPITITPGGVIDGSVGLFPGLWIYTPAAATRTLQCNLFAFQYTGLVR